MERIARVLLLGLIAVFAFSACGKTPLSIPLDDFSLDIEATTNTAGYVVYPVEPASFEKPVINVKSITISGNATVTYTAAPGDNLQMTFYASAKDPDENGCTKTGPIYVCPKDGEKAITDSYTFINGDTKPIMLGSKNADVLTEGINQGFIWIGLEVTSGAATNVHFDFTDMVANVILF